MPIRPTRIPSRETAPPAIRRLLFYRLQTATPSPHKPPTDLKNLR